MTTPIRTGLTAEQVAERIAAGEVNTTTLKTSRSVAEIVRANVFTIFNGILGVLLVLMLAFGSPKDALFGLVLVANTAIGIVQELRAKFTLDRLALLVAPRCRVVRDGAEVEIPLAEVVLGDLVMLSAGDQVPADGRVVANAGLEIDESLLTGESVPVRKEIDAEVLSGSFVAAGAGRFVTTAVGEAAYANRIAAEGRRFTLVRSELVEGINRILKAIIFVILPTAALLVIAAMRQGLSLADGVTNTVAALVGMVPEGLVLLTSVAFALSAVVLARRNVLIQELPTVEGLARVDVICVDKTGTITEPVPVFGRIETLGAAADGVAAVSAFPEVAAEAEAALGALARTNPARNATVDAITAAVPAPDGWIAGGIAAFSSARKWSAAEFAERGTWVLGAPDVILDHIATGSDTAEGVLAASIVAARGRVAALASEGPRVLLLAHTPEPLTAASDSLPADLEPVALVLLAERIRPDAGTTIAYFAEQGVAVKVISGDAAATVGTIAMQAGVQGADAPVDARSLPAPGSSDLADALEATSVFGRVTPEQKRDMVAALQSRGHVVAMTGDGVNDVLALKQADIGIAMGSGSAAAKAVAQLVLLDGRFANMPPAVAEGRRVIANAERVSNLFLTKTTYATILAIVSALAAMPYPFLPRHLTLVGAITIGIPAFFLALMPNSARYRPGFVGRVLKFAVPAGVALAIGLLGIFLASRGLGASLDEARTLTTVALSVLGLRVIQILERPVRGWRRWLLGSMVCALLLALVLPVARAFFEFTLPSLAAWPMVVLTAAITLAGWFALGANWHFVQKAAEKR
ncbi:MAG: HAD-IC family P-type ATPase [Coriobacteriia bacterium]|nr:HAD-IC family P-type ATPase [Coriobacteriia bacterium]